MTDSRNGRPLRHALAREGTCGEVADILGDPLRLEVWWPSVYLEVEEIEPARAEGGVGRRVRLLTKGWLPYTLRWELVVVESTLPARLHDCRDGRPGRNRCLDVRAGWRRCRHHLRLADPGREAAAPQAVVSAQAAVRGEPPVGDGRRGAELEARTGTAAGDLGRRAPGDSGAARPDDAGGRGACWCGRGRCDRRGVPGVPNAAGSQVRLKPDTTRGRCVVSAVRPTGVTSRAASSSIGARAAIQR